MAIFAILQQPGEPGTANLPAKIASTYPGAYVVSSTVWLVADRGTAIDVSNKLGLTSGPEMGSAIVLEVASYHGRANPAVWSWIKEKWEVPTLG